MADLALVAADSNPMAEIDEDVIVARLAAGYPKLSPAQKIFVRRVIDFQEPLHRAAERAGLQQAPRGKTVLNVISLERELRRRNPFVPPEVLAQSYWSLYQRAAEDEDVDAARKCLNDLATFQGMMPDQRLDVTLTHNQPQQIPDAMLELLALREIERHREAAQATEAEFEEVPSNGP